jgi:DHA2 family multidrug resistance protein
LNVGFWNFWWPLIIQGAALGFIFVPLTTVTNNPIPKERLGNATSLFNLMRNLGASIGIALVQTYQFRKEQIHTNILGAHVNPYSAESSHMIDALRSTFMARGSDMADATRKAYDSVWGMVRRHAMMLSYNDTFLLLAIMFIAMLPFLFLLRKPKAGGPVMAH